MSAGGPRLARLGPSWLLFVGLLLAPPTGTDTGWSPERAAAWAAPAVPIVADGAYETDADPDPDATAPVRDTTLANDGTPGARPPADHTARGRALPRPTSRAPPLDESWQRQLRDRSRPPRAA